MHAGAGVRRTNSSLARSADSLGAPLGGAPDERLGALTATRPAITGAAADEVAMAAREKGGANARWKASVAAHPSLPRETSGLAALIDPASQKRRPFLLHLIALLAEKLTERGCDTSQRCARSTLGSC